jgi:hypothetical protein
VAEQVDPYEAPRAELDGRKAADRTTALPLEAVTSLLAQTRPWVKLIAIFCFVATALMVLVVVGVLAAGGDRTKATAFVPLLVMLLLYLPPASFLWKYAGGIAELQRGGGQTALEKALRSQKGFWKYVGILTCVMMGLYAIGLVGMLALGFGKH